MLVKIIKDSSWYSEGEIYDVEFNSVDGYYRLLRNPTHTINRLHCNAVILIRQGTFEYKKKPEVNFALETSNLNVICAYNRLINPK